MRQAESERSDARSVSRNETQVSEAKHDETCKSNYPIAKGYWELYPKLV